MNKSSLIKFSLVCAAALVAVGATIPQKSFGQETGTVPVIKAQPLTAISNVKDNSTIPVIIAPGQTDVTAPPSGTPDDASFTLNITVDAPTTVDTTLELDTNHPEAIGLPSTVVVPAGSSTVSVTVPVIPGDADHHKHVKIYVSSNGTTIANHIRVHYQSEVD